MSCKTVNPTMESHQYMALWYRYMRFICCIEKVTMLTAMERFGNRFKILYFKKMRSKKLCG
jgi:hypothetical protein